MTIVQCPGCDLRFSTEPDLDDHVAKDHPEFSADTDNDTDRALKEMNRRHPLK